MGACAAGGNYLTSMIQVSIVAMVTMFCVRVHVHVHVSTTLCCCITAPGIEYNIIVTMAVETSILGHTCTTDASTPGI